MAIIHQYSDKQSKKFKFTILIYILIALLILLIASISYSKLPKTPQTNSQTHIKKTICISNSITQDIADKISSYDSTNYTLQTIQDNMNCNISIERNVKDPNEYQKVFSKIYVIAKSYNNPLENITKAQLTTILNNQTVNNTQYTTVWDENTDNYLRTKFNMGVGQVITTTENLSSSITNSQNNRALAIIPFEQLKPIYSVVGIDENNPLSKDFNTIKYPLIDTYWIKGEDKNETNQIIEYLNKQLQFSNYDTTKLTTITLTGSSSIGSGEQDSIYSKNKEELHIINPILNNLLNTDILQINNENTFVNNCIQYKLSNFLCSNPKYLDILTKLNANSVVVGVNGNHILDYGLDEYTNTLKLYKQKGLKYYGGGNNSAESNTPLVIEKNGSKIAFLGYNLVDPLSYYSTKNKAGNANIDEAILKRDIQNAKKQADIIVIDMSWGYENKRQLVQYQIDFANIAIQNGADIIIGTNGLVPQKLEVNSSNIIAYNLGGLLPSNLDPMRKNGSLIIKLYLYNGKIVATKIIPLTLDTHNQIQLASGELKDRILGSVR